MKSIIIRHGGLKVVVHPDYERLAEFAASVPRLFDSGQGRVLHSGRNEVRLFSVCGVDVVAKRYKRVNAIQRVVYSFFRKTKAERAYLFAQLFRERGVDTPHEIAYMEQSRGLLFETGYFLCENCPDPPAFDRLVTPERFDEPMAADLAAFIDYMHSRGILHGDMNFGNFLYRTDLAGHYRFTVIDTNRSHFRDGYPARKECLCNLRTATHRRDVYEYIVRAYARQRRWDESEAVAEANLYLDKFEERHRRKEKLKKLQNQKKANN